MLAASARTLAARDPQALAELARQLGMPVTEQAAASRSAHRRARTTATTGDMGNRRETPDAAANGASQHGAAFPAETYRAFEATTNDDVSRKMHEAIRPVTDFGAARGNRLRERGGASATIFREVHAGAFGDRELAKQVGETLRDWRFRRECAAASSCTGVRPGARAVLPEVARRVVAEWTSSVLASDPRENGAHRRGGFAARHHWRAIARACGGKCTAFAGC